VLVRFPSIGRRGLHRLGVNIWRACDNDPQFQFFLRFLPLPFLVLHLKNADRLLDPRIYIDRGDGYESNEEIELRPTRSGIYVIALRTLGSVRRIRFDPSSCPAQFEFRAFVGYNAQSVRKFIGGKLRHAEPVAGVMPTCETVAKGDGALSLGFGKSARSIRNVADHFEELIALAATRFSHQTQWRESKPLISFIVPVFNTPPRYLDQLVESFRIQGGGAWELILCDDGSTSPETAAWLEKRSDISSLKIVRSAVNAGIAAATNSGLAVARGEWIGLVDHDDALSPFAIALLVETILERPDALFIYTDEAITDRNLKPRAYFLKPAFDPVLLSGVNYINHLSVYRRDRLARIGGLRKGFEGSQDYDLLLRYLSGLDPKQILHLPYPAYLWRRDGKSYSVAFLDLATQNARRALAESNDYGGVFALVEPALDANLHRLRFDKSIDNWPSVSIVIPNCDSFALISRVLDDLILRTDYPDLEIVVADNGSKDPRVLELYARMQGSEHAFYADIVEEKFNFSRQINRGVRLAHGEYILLLNNDIETRDSSWLKEMVSCFSYPGTGIVGARLVYPNGALQHAGVIVGLGGVAGHWFCGESASHPGPMGRLNVRQSLSAVTGACMLISKQCLEAVGEFDETVFSIAYNDVDFCLRAGRRGFRVVWTPFATLVHHESASRGSDETPSNIERFRREQEALRAKYALATYVDPAFNPWYGRGHGTPRLTMLGGLPNARIFRP
jgi:GT2 family glycosyltransferase